MRWRLASLASLCHSIYSGGTPPTSNDAYYGGDIPWLRTQEVTFGRITDTEIKITEAGLKNSAAKWVPANSVVVAMYGNSAGRSAITEIPLTTNQACCNLVVDSSKSDYRYIFYSLSQHYEQLKGLSRGAAQNNLNAAQIKAFEIPVPSVHVQRAIGDLLSTYDDLINNNRRRMALLEDSARQLYREWFVRLRFPGHEHTPNVESVPQGWERKLLGDLCSEVRDMVLPEALEPDTPYIGLEHIPRRSISLNDWGTVEEVTSSKCRFKTGEIIFGKIRPYFHKVGVAFVDGVTSSDAIV
jgi:type I restriction enzyme S subunit